MSKNKHAAKPKVKESEIQPKMPLKYSGIPFFQKFSYRLKKGFWVIEQIKFWRSFALWTNIFINITVPFLIISWFFSNMDKLPHKLPFLFYYTDQTQRFIPISYILAIFGANIAFQIITIYISSKIFTKFKQLSYFLLIFSFVSTLFVYGAIFKSLTIVLS